MNRLCGVGAFAILALAVGSQRVRAQEPINAADSATQASPGQVIFKEQVRFYSLDLNGDSGDRSGNIKDIALQTTLNIGLRSDLSLSFRFPTLIRKRSYDRFDATEREEGIGDLTLVGKWRFYQEDTSPLDTLRISLIGGAQIRSGDSPFTSDAYNPILGLAFTKVAGRHGLNGSFEWTFTTNGNEQPVYAGESTADLFRYDLAYLFRVSPAEFSADTPGALYAVCEVNGLYETNGDNELLVSPGLMYEAKTWTAELSVQIPTWQEIEQRAEIEYVVVAGIRLFW